MERNLGKMIQGQEIVFSLKIELNPKTPTFVVNEYAFFRIDKEKYQRKFAFEKSKKSHTFEKVNTQLRNICTVLL